MLTEKFFGSRAGNAHGIYVEDYWVDEDGYEHDDTYLDGVEGHIVTIFFNGEENEVCKVLPGDGFFMDRYCDDDGYYDYTTEHEQIDAILEKLNWALEIIASGGANKEEAIALINSEFSNGTEEINNWRDYFEYRLLAKCGSIEFEVNEALLPDFESLREGKFVFNNEAD